MANARIQRRRSSGLTPARIRFFMARGSAWPLSGDNIASRRRYPLTADERIEIHELAAEHCEELSTAWHARRKAELARRRPPNAPELKPEPDWQNFVP